MKIFADTANVEEIKQLVSWGIIDGATTNPTLLSKEKRDPMETLRLICELVEGPVSAEVISTDWEGMVRDAKELCKIHENIVIKIPFTIEGMKATKALRKEGIRVNMTLIFSPGQALLAAKLGATFISPFIGRLDDISHEGMNIVRETKRILQNYNFQTELLVASIRHPMHVIEAALLGADIVTVPPKVIRQLVVHPLTDIGLERFLKDWEKLKGKKEL